MSGADFGYLILGLIATVIVVAVASAGRMCAARNSRTQTRASSIVHSRRLPSIAPSGRPPRERR